MVTSRSRNLIFFLAIEKHHLILMCAFHCPMYTLHYGVTFMFDIMWVYIIPQLSTHSLNCNWLFITSALSVCLKSVVEIKLAHNHLVIKSHCSLMGYSFLWLSLTSITGNKVYFFSLKINASYLLRWRGDSLPIKKELNFELQLQLKLFCVDATHHAFMSCKTNRSWRR